jgi:hypothetical protein
VTVGKIVLAALVGGLAAVLALPLVRAAIRDRRRGPREFAIWGVTRPGDVRIRRLPGGRLGFGLTALGRVTGALNGTFSFIEQGEASLRTASGTNEGTMSVVTAGGGQLVIRFSGQTDLRRVWGTWETLRGAESLGGLAEQGVYSGNAGLVFTVRFADR